MRNNRKLIFIPTYNEKENVEKIYSGIAQLGLDIDLLFLDDNSPDGTGDILAKLAMRNTNITVIHRDRKSGIGSAHREGICWAYEHGYDQLITMDCDLTHSPEYIPFFLKYSEEYQLVIGSRYLNEDSLVSWGFFRKLLTLLGHFLTKYLLGMPYDASGAYRLYRLDKIPKKLFNFVRSDGYAFFFESLYILHKQKVAIKEVPIVLPARSEGNSKMNFREMQKGIFYLFYFAILSKFKKFT